MCIHNVDHASSRSFDIRSITNILQIVMTQLKVSLFGSSLSMTLRSLTLNIYIKIVGEVDYFIDYFLFELANGYCRRDKKKS